MTWFAIIGAAWVLALGLSAWMAWKTWSLTGAFTTLETRDALGFRYSRSATMAFAFPAMILLPGLVMAWAAIRQQAAPTLPPFFILWFGFILAAQIGMLLAASARRADRARRRRELYGE